MGFFELFLIGIGLSMDAFAVAICKGLGMERINKRDTLLLVQFVSIRTHNEAETIQLISDCSHFLCYQRFNNNSHYLSLLFKLRYCQ